MRRAPRAAFFVGFPFYLLMETGEWQRYKGRRSAAFLNPWPPLVRKCSFPVLVLPQLPDQREGAQVRQAVPCFVKYGLSYFIASVSHGQISVIVAIQRHRYFSNFLLCEVVAGQFVGKVLSCLSCQFGKLRDSQPAPLQNYLYFLAHSKHHEKHPFHCLLLYTK